MNNDSTGMKGTELVQVHLDERRPALRYFGGHAIFRVHDRPMLLIIDETGTFDASVFEKLDERSDAFQPAAVASIEFRESDLLSLLRERRERFPELRLTAPAAMYDIPDITSSDFVLPPGKHWQHMKDPHQPVWKPTRETLRLNLPATRRCFRPAPFRVRFPWRWRGKRRVM